MTYLLPEDRITLLPLSARALHCAQRNGIRTIGEFITKNTDDWEKSRNLGVKTLEEIQSVRASIIDGSGDYILISDATSKSSGTESIESTNGLSLAQMNPNIIYFDEKGKILQDVPIERIAKSIKVINSLRKNNILWVSQLIGMTNEDIKSIPGIGFKIASEIRDIVNNIMFIQIDPQSTTVNVPENETSSNTLVSELVNTYGNDESYWIRIIMKINDDFPEASGETRLYRLYELDEIRTAAKDFFLNIIEKNSEISISSFNSQMPSHFYNTTIVEELLLELESSGKIFLSETKITRVYPSVIQYLKQIPIERERTALLARMNGATLDEIGKDYGITRERVRQLLLKAFRKFKTTNNSVRFAEDIYVPLFTKYHIFEKDFSAAFGEPKSTYCYLEMSEKKNNAEKLPLSEVLTDETISYDLRKKAEIIIYKDYITDNGYKVKKHRNELVKHYVRTYCKDQISYDSFEKEFNSWLETLDIDNIKSFRLDTRTYINALSTSSYVLWNYGSKFRYYNILERDFCELIDTLDLEQYENIELSTAKWYRDYPDVMTRYDIHDAFELHNLLKKLDIEEKYGMTFKKMPTVVFGNGNADTQALDLLIQYAPISAEKLSQLYEDTYGVRADVARGTIFARAIGDYFYQGEYRIDQPILSTEQFNRMTNILIDDFYTVPEIKRIFQREFPGSNPNLVNPYTIKTLGFMVYSAESGYAIKNHFQSASNYFNWLLTNSDVVDLRNNRKITIYKSYYSELRELRSRYEIIEFSPLQFINIRRLNTLGITIEQIKDYCNAVYNYTVKGEYFSIESLRNNGFKHDLDDLGFDEWFYSSILAEDTARFSYQRAGGTRIFLVGTSNIQLGNLFTAILEKYQKIDFYDFHIMLEEYYGLKIPKDKCKEILTNTDLYYDVIMDAIYIDYDTYFEEI